MQMSVRGAVALRVVAIALAIACGSFLSIQNFALAVIVLGQGHFLLAYLYQAEAGKLPPRKIALLGAGLAFLLWAVFSLPLALAGLITALGFLIHFALDEARLLGDGYSLYATLEALPFISLYTALFADSIYGTHTFPFVGAALLPCVAVYFYLVYRNKRAPTNASYAFLAWFLLTVFAYGLHIAYGTAIDPLVWFWGIVIVHYVIWYGVYWVRLTPKPILRREYALRVFFVNALLVVCAYLWLQEQFGFFAILFTPAMYYVWTFLHGFASFRGNELKDSFSFPSRA